MKLQGKGKKRRRSTADDSSESVSSASDKGIDSDEATHEGIKKDTKGSDSESSCPSVDADADSGVEPMTDSVVKRVVACNARSFSAVAPST